MLPRVVIHNAMTADGRLTGFMPDMGLYYELAGSFAEDATLSGADTALAGLEQFADDAAGFEEAGALEDRSSLPLMVITDSRGRVRAWRQFLGMPFWRAGVALVSRSTPADYLAYLEAEGVDTIVTGEERVDLRAALEELNARYGIENIRMDSGGTLNGAMLRSGLVDELSLLVSPCLIGGRDFVSLVTASDFPPLDLELVSARELRGGNVWLRYRVVR